MPDTVLTATHAEVGHAQLANAIRFLSMDAVEKAQSGHPGLPMGCADIATVLFTRFLKFDPTDPGWADRDRFVLSAGHGSMLLYSLLYLTGYADMPLDELKQFRQLGSRTAGHPEYGHAAGIETTTGPLGQGLANAVGMALAERLMAARFGSELVDHTTYVLASDGDLMEGISQEAIGLAGHHRLNKLIVLYDDNGISIDGPTSLAFTEDSLGRFAASGWAVTRVDGHDPEAVADAIEAARLADRPSLIACRTVIGFGAAKKAGTAAAHGSPLGAEEIAASRAKLGWSHAPFEVPAPILAAWRAAGARGAAARVAWERRLAGHPDLVEFRRRMAGELPSGWAEAAAALKRQLAAEKPKLATRQSSGRALETLTQAIPELIGGSADLTGSVNTKTKETKPVSVADPAGRYIHWGVREHGMAAAMNGMALHGGVIPYSGTFLAFSDYSRPAIRLAGLMGIRVIHVLTHDSIGLGEDGPTHQPVEHLAALRAIPNLHVFRPADAMETAECWELALARTDGPSGLVLTRQALPALRQDDGRDNLSARGAYVLARPSTERKVTLLATGSEVQLAVEAQQLLAKEGIAAAVVSMPCWELFETQDSAYREEVLRPDTIRVAVEAAGAFGWTRYVASEADVVGMPGFGASGPAEALYQHFGITAEAVVARVRSRLGRG